MPEVVAFDEIKERRTRREMPDGHFYNTPFIDHSGEYPNGPNAFMIESSENRILDTHFHDVDQFQLLVGGGGKLGRHTLAPHAVHFSRGFTPYGPLVSGPGAGVSYVTLRARQCPTGGAQRLPAFREKLEKMPGRQPWQVTGAPEFVPPSSDGVTMQVINGLKDELGLAGYSLSMTAGARIMGPDPSGGDGQYLVVLRGSLMHDGKEKKGITVVFTKPQEGPLQVVAGPDGLEALVLNFPQPVLPVSVIAATGHANAPAAGHDKLWQCELCSYAYNEAAGLPEEGIPPGTRWEDVPHDWVCPDCSAQKADFSIVDL